MQSLTYKGMQFRVYDKVYFPREDSFLVLNNLSFKSRENILELGTGCGIIAITCAKKGAQVVATDISKQALRCAQNNAKANAVEIKFVKSDLFEKVSGRFDKIIFNAPYLPCDRKSLLDKTECGGKKGDELLLKVVEQARRYLKKGGALYVVCSSLSGDFLNKLKKSKYKIIARQKLFFEEIFLVEIRFE